MLARVVNHIIDSIFPRLPAPALLCPLAAGSSSFTGLTVKDIFDGLDYATPKRKRNIFEKWRRKYGSVSNCKDGIKLWHPKHNITTCPTCGNFHLFHTICRTCYKKIEDESQPILNSIRNTWGHGIIDKEVQVLYNGESAPESTTKRIVEVDRPRPLWWAQNLSQKSANPFKQIKGPTTELVDKTVRLKEDNNTNT